MPTNVLQIAVVLVKGILFINVREITGIVIEKTTPLVDLSSQEIDADCSALVKDLPSLSVAPTSINYTGTFPRPWVKRPHDTVTIVPPTKNTVKPKPSISEPLDSGHINKTVISNTATIPSTISLNFLIKSQLIQPTLSSTASVFLPLTISTSQKSAKQVQPTILSDRVTSPMSQGKPEDQADDGPINNMTADQAKPTMSAINTTILKVKGLSPGISMKSVLQLQATSFAVNDTGYSTKIISKQILPTTPTTISVTSPFLKMPSVTFKDILLMPHLKQKARSTATAIPGSAQYSQINKPPTLPNAFAVTQTPISKLTPITNHSNFKTNEHTSENDTESNISFFRNQFSEGINNLVESSIESSVNGTQSGNNSQSLQTINNSITNKKSKALPATTEYIPTVTIIPTGPYVSQVNESLNYRRINISSTLVPTATSERQEIRRVTSTTNTTVLHSKLSPQENSPSPTNSSEPLTSTPSSDPRILRNIKETITRDIISLEKELNFLLASRLPMALDVDLLDLWTAPYLQRLKHVNHEMVDDILQSEAKNPPKSSECPLEYQDLLLRGIQRMLGLLLISLPQSLKEIEEAMWDPELDVYFFRNQEKSVLDIPHCIDCYTKDNRGVCREIFFCKNGARPKAAARLTREQLKRLLASRG